MTVLEKKYNLARSVYEYTIIRIIWTNTRTKLQFIHVKCLHYDYDVIKINVLNVFWIVSQNIINHINGSSKYLSKMFVV